METTTITNVLGSRASLLLEKDAAVENRRTLPMTAAMEGRESAVMGISGATAVPMVVEEKPNYPLWRLILVASGWLGIQMIWALEYALTMPFFTQRLHISYAVSGLIWSAGPITGFLVQPIVGSFSDTCTSRWGRRRPFIVAGVVLTVLASFLFSFSERFGGHSTSAAVGLAVFSFWIMDVSINMTMGPFRALLSDLASHDQQSLAQTLASLFQGCGQIIGFLIPSAFEAPLYSIEIIFAIAYASMAGTVLLSCLFARERLNLSLTMATKEAEGDDGMQTKTRRGAGSRIQRGFVSVNKTIRRGFVNVYWGIRHMPLTMLPVAFVQAMTWFAWFCFMPYATDWFARTVYQADPGSPRYEEGVAAGSRASAFQAVVQLVFSFFCPIILRFVPLKWTYMFCLADLAVCMFVAGFVRERHVATLVVALTGIALAATNIFPFAIVGRLYSDENKKGLIMGMLNVFIVIPQLIDTAYTGTIVERYGPQYVMICGACWAVLATIMVLFIRTKTRSPMAVPPPTMTTYGSHIGATDASGLYSASKSQTIFQADEAATATLLRSLATTTTAAVPDGTRAETDDKKEPATPTTKPAF